MRVRYFHSSATLLCSDSATEKCPAVVCMRCTSHSCSFSFANMSTATGVWLSSLILFSPPRCQLMNLTHAQCPTSATDARLTVCLFWALKPLPAFVLMTSYKTRTAYQGKGCLLLLLWALLFSPYGVHYTFSGALPSGVYLLQACIDKCNRSCSRFVPG